LRSPGDSVTADTRHQGPTGRRFFLVLASLTTLGPFALDMYLPALPSLARDLRVSESASQLTLTACLVGLGVGQLIVGPVSDALGRRLPLVAALLTFTAATLLCAAAPSLELLVGFRGLQGMAGGGAGVIAIAMVRDHYSGTAAARLFSLLLVVTLLSPLLAPTLGGELMLVTSWRGVFIAVAAIGLLILLAAVLGLPESLPSGRRRQGGFWDAAQTMGRLGVDRSFISYAIPAALTTAALFTYLAGSSFVLEQIYGTSPQVYGLLFGLNGLTLGISSQLNRWMLNRVSAESLFGIGVAGSVIGGVALLAALAFGIPGLPAIIGPVLLIVASNGFVGPNSLALALSPHPDVAGSGSALLGSLRFGIGGLMAPLVGLMDVKSAVPLGVIMCTCCVGAAIVYLSVKPKRNGVFQHPEIADVL
jgi:DHA1 family bicyclomycin/chloramphenicol resistance-like MFS transporter